MNPISIIFGGISGALGAATGGKVSLDKIVTQAVTNAASSPLTKLEYRDVGNVAEVIKQELPSPKAMEALWPQLLRSVLMVLGGYLAGQGYLEKADMESLVTAALLVGPVLWRVVTTWIARRRAA